MLTEDEVVRSIANEIQRCTILQEVASLARIVASFRSTISASGDGNDVFSAHGIAPLLRQPTQTSVGAFLASLKLNIENPSLQRRNFVGTWTRGKLEQMWQGSQGTQSWEEVPNYQPPKSNTVPSDTSK